jgi:drug/metabolite transporter (DMT)-like permease
MLAAAKHGGFGGIAGMAGTETAGDGGRRRFWLGSYLALQSAVGFSLNLITAKFAYEHGTDPLTLNFVRVVFFVSCLFLFLVAARRPMALPWRPRAMATLYGLIIAVQSLGLFAAIDFIPVSLVVLVFYTYPIIVAVIGTFTGAERFTWARLVVLLVAFAGLGLALQVPTGGLDWRGIAYSAAAALGLAFVLLGSDRTMRGRDSVVVTFHMILGTAVTMTVVAAAFGPLVWPTDRIGWAALAGSGVLFGVATMSLFAAIPMIGALRAAVIDNSSPVWAILFAFLLLGETLSPIQGLGATLVVAAIIAMQFTGRTRQAVADQVPIMARPAPVTAKRTGSSGPPQPAGTKRLWIGLILVVMAALTFALMLVFANLAYSRGTDPMTVSMVRNGVGAVVMAGLLFVGGQSMRLPPRDALIALALGLVLGFQTYGLLGAVGFISVSLTVLIFYTYPILVAITNRVLFGEPITPTRATAMVVTFAGLVLALLGAGGTGGEGSGADWRGIALAAMGALTLTACFVGTGHYLAGRDNRVVMLHMMVAMGLGFVAAWSFTPDTGWPRDPIGWLQMMLACLAFSISIPCLFGAIQVFGPVRASLVDTSSPIWAIVVSALVLGEALTEIQLGGAALVVGGIFLLQSTELLAMRRSR